MANPKARVIHMPSLMPRSTYSNPGLVLSGAAFTKPVTKRRGAAPSTVRRMMRGSSERRRTANRRDAEEVFASGYAAT